MKATIKLPEYNNSSFQQIDVSVESMLGRIALRFRPFMIIDDRYIYWSYLNQIEFKFQEEKQIIERLLIIHDII